LNKNGRTKSGLTSTNNIMAWRHIVDLHYDVSLVTAMSTETHIKRYERRRQSPRSNEARVERPKVCRLFPAITQIARATEGRFTDDKR
jgi:hypothetical protein